LTEGTGRLDTSYKQELNRSLGVGGLVALGLSAVTPAASVFVIASVTLQNQGTGAFLSFMLGAFITLGLGLCFAELGSAFPISGALYPSVARVLGRPIGFLAMIAVIVSVTFALSGIALGAATFLSVVFSNLNPHAVGTIMIVVTTLLAVFSIQFNARLTVAFLAIELTAIAVVVVLGLAHAHRSVSILFNPVTASGASVSFSAILAGVATAVLAYSGCENVISFSEENRGHRRHIAFAVLFVVAVTVLTELLPIGAAILGAPSLKQLSSAPLPLSYVVESLGSHTLNVIVSLGIFIAVFNAILAEVLAWGRIIYSSGRDRAWPLPISNLIGSTHPRFGTPWVGQTILGVTAAVITAVSSLAYTITFTAVLLVVAYGLVAISAIVHRLSANARLSTYRMPVWPLPALIALAGIILTLTKQKHSDLLYAGLIFAGCIIYYVIYIVPRRKTHWVMLAPPDEEGEFGIHVELEEADPQHGLPGRTVV
jgi:amino acid transporter